MHSFIHLFRVTDQKAPRCKWHDKRKASCQKMLMPNGTENASKDCYREQNRETLERKNPDTKKSPLIVSNFFQWCVITVCKSGSSALQKSLFTSLPVRRAKIVLREEEVKCVEINLQKSPVRWWGFLFCYPFCCCHSIWAKYPIAWRCSSSVSRSSNADAASDTRKMFQFLLFVFWRTSQMMGAKKHCPRSF